MILPLTSDMNILDHFLAGCSGLMLTGGGDVNPSRYRAKLTASEHKALSGVDDVRDAMEIYLVRQAVRLAVPVFGICRGIQLMNVAFGGTLIPDLPGHRNPKPDALAHRLEWSKPTQMPVCGRVNTSHHQAVDRSRTDLEPVARAREVTLRQWSDLEMKFFRAVQFQPDDGSRAAIGGCQRPSTLGGTESGSASGCSLGAGWLRCRPNETPCSRAYALTHA